MRTTRSLVGLVGWVALSFVPGWFGSQFPPGAWYEQLDKPAWTPPDAVFGPVWTLLYLLMGIAAWLVWRRRGLAGARGALTLFVIQLALNGAWSWLFFGLQRPDLALLCIAALWAAVIATAVAFWRHRRAAGLLLAPYAVWLTYAVALNLAIVQRNL